MMGADGGALAPCGRDVAPGLKPGGAEVATTGAATATGAAGAGLGSGALASGAAGMATEASALAVAWPALVTAARSLAAGALFEFINFPKLSSNACVSAVVPCVFT